jgi:hypothetical protein
VRKIDFDETLLGLLEAEAKRLRTTLSGLVNLLADGSWTPPWSAPIRPQCGPNPAHAETLAIQHENSSPSNGTCAPSVTRGRTNPETYLSPSQEEETERLPSVGGEAAKSPAKKARKKRPGDEKVERLFAFYDEYETDRPTWPVAQKFLGSVGGDVEKLLSLLENLAVRGMLKEGKYVWGAIQNEGKRLQPTPVAESEPAPRESYRPAFIHWKNMWLADNAEGQPTEERDWSVEKDGPWPCTQETWRRDLWGEPSADALSHLPSSLAAPPDQPGQSAGVHH